MSRKIHLFLLPLLLTCFICCSKIENLPNVKTTEITNISGLSATSGGLVIDDFGDSIVAKGVCWGLKKNPTIGTNMTNDGKGKGSYVSKIVDLSGETTYFVRAYATNSFGTGYGNTITFKTLIDPRILEAQMIQTYLSNNSNYIFQLKTSGLYYYDIKMGTGPTPVTHDYAYIKYTGKFLNGTILDTNVGRNDTLIIRVGEGWLIAGCDEGVTYMKVGGKALFLIPSKLAYGTSGYYIIPGYTPLLFEVELVKLKK